MGTRADDDFAAYAAGRWTSLVRSAVLLGCSHSDAEDAAQAALVRTWSGWGRVSRAAEPDAYVYRILVNTLATSRRRKWWGEQPTSAVPEVRTTGATGATGDVELRDVVVSALRGLPVEQRQVLVLRYVADLSERATAEALGIALGTVKSRAARGLAALEATDLAAQVEGIET